MNEASGNKLDAYEIEASHERSDVLQDLAEFQLGAVSGCFEFKIVTFKSSVFIAFKLQSRKSPLLRSSPIDYHYSGALIDYHYSGALIDYHFAVARWQPLPGQLLPLHWYLPELLPRAEVIQSFFTPQSQSL
jgi:hypothetical protein